MKLMQIYPKRKEWHFLLALCAVAISGCHSFCPARCRPNSSCGCDSLGDCAGYTETHWDTLDYCGFGESSEYQLHEQEFVPQSYIEQASYEELDEDQSYESDINNEVLAYADAQSNDDDLEIESKEHFGEDNYFQEIEVDYLP